MADWWARNWKKVATGAFTAVAVPFFMSVTGVMDLRLGSVHSRPEATSSGTGSQPRNSANSAAPHTASPSSVVLAGASPVRIVWTGHGDLIDAAWQPMHLPALTWYSVDVYGFTPVENVWYNVGYRDGEQLRTSASTDPIAASNEKFADAGLSTRVDHTETWRVCVTGMRTVPGGGEVAKYAIVGSKRCSDYFVIPSPG